MSKIGIIVAGSTQMGGVYQYTLSFLESLKSIKKHDVVIFYTDDSFISHLEGFECRKIVPPGRWLKYLNFLFLILRVRISIFVPSKTLDVVKDIGLFISPSISTYPFYHTDKPYIFTLHDFQDRYYPDFFTFRDRLIRWVITRALSNSASGIVCESHYVKKDILRFTKCNEDLVHVIQSPPNGMYSSHSRDSASLLRVRKVYKLPNRFIFYPATTWEHKNHIRLIHVFSDLRKLYPDLFLVLSGNKTKYWLTIQKEILNLDLGNKIVHLDFVKSEDLPYVYQHAECLVMPSCFESISIPVFEAFFVGTPVCSSNAVGIAEQVGDCGVLFDPFDTKDMFSKISKILDDVHLRESLATKAKNHLNHFSSSYALKVEELIESCI